MEKMGEHMKMNLIIFKYKNECHEQLELKNKMEKVGNLSSFHVSFLSYGP